MRHPRFLLLLLVLLLSTAATAQDETRTKEAAETRVEKEVTRVNDILKIIGLPGIAEDAREAGVPEEDIRIILEESEKQELPPAETEIILREGSDATLENGPIDNFGAFVQERLRSGLRGQELSAAIHAEHKARGKGKGKGQSQGKGKGHDKDRDQDHGHDHGDNDKGDNDNEVHNDGEHKDKGNGKNNKGGKK
ncbi:MAG: hypothetical protein QNL91_14530 [Candidatus Krumholzibacteria bacterium]|nr:hypothetical protein [Candidatus Krumholzibacteria bacterium]